VVTAKIYIEGGGTGELYDTLFRRAWSAFFKAAGLIGRMPRVVRGQGRAQTFDAFTTAVRSPRNDGTPFLLVDSEGAVAVGHTVWQHLKSRDDWDKPSNVVDDQAFLMVQLMETWFLADRALLRSYFGQGFREAHLRQWPALEQVPKDTVLLGLDRATVDCRTPYSKGKVSYGLLESVDPRLVEAACPHARQLLDRLREL